ncbi:MAG: sigma 54-interacting transcriptional regulator [Deltaproteobacteria bacterium]|nr:sigma 54-interacting transcriptional regulator [Deltaproteobacteria bacterium]
MPLSRQSMSPAPRLAGAASREAASPIDRCLVVQGRRVPLLPGRELVIGNGARADVRLDAPGMSARHATFYLDERGVTVRDGGSATGTWRRGARVGGQVIARDGGVIVGREPILIGAAFHEGALRWHGMVARHPRALADLGAIVRVASARAPVWIAGESGTGKEAVARAIHAESARHAGPYVAINCAAIQENLAEAELFGSTRGAFTGAVKPRAGAFVQANHGTLLLDEIGELPLAIQAKLLRVIETGEVTPVGSDHAIKVDVRLVVSTWRDLEREAAVGRFRHDLLHRIWVLKLPLAPLRERKGDIGPLVAHFLQQGGAPELTPSAPVIELLARYAWPGNVRELRNHVERAIAFHDPIAMVPSEVLGARLPRRSRRAPEHLDDLGQIIRSTLRAHANHRGRAARALGVSRSTLYRWFHETSFPGRVDTPNAPFMMAQASTRET